MLPMELLLQVGAHHFDLLPSRVIKKEVINNHIIDSTLNKTSKDIYAQKGSSNKLYTDLQ